MQQEIIHELVQQWTTIKGKNPNYSLRAFAKKLDVPHSALSEILNGKRKLTKKMATRILFNLKLVSSEQERILKILDESTEYSTLELQSFQAISHWEHLAVLGLFKLKDFKSDITWMAKRLGITIKKVDTVIDTLLSVGLVSEDNGKFKRKTSSQLNTPTQIKDKGLRQFAIESLEKAIESLKEDPVEKRDFTTVSLTVNKKDIPKAKKMLEEFRYKFDQEIETVPGEELYKLVLGFYPVTKESME